ncbi:hypothetical protein DCS_05625 [Drechmeria coniospora]|uniref:SGNH hydrolase-type esterase domain-containing protein n=1 Tax=Drechmeria coniospora TaxID=98403 RepID=A0A151GNG1_DRECN|nr:hypothetical protein DCS_05625 [Drechmeria coniospora]KYK58608.1 hypothetical protein DCS_05625 [Drechmeria coniospora]
MADGPLSILCFGDSLTQGYHSFGMGKNPYGEKLEETLKAAMPGRDIRVYVNGVPGDFATGQAFSRRLRQASRRIRAGPTGDVRPYDWVIILGGTNDLARCCTGQMIVDALKACWDIPLAKGSKVLALTVPESRPKPDWLAAQLVRSPLPRLLSVPSLGSPRADHDAVAPPLTRLASYSFDLHAKVPFHSLSVADQDKYWDDGLHLTADGYWWMGGHIADGLLQIFETMGGGQQKMAPQ